MVIEALERAAELYRQHFILQMTKQDSLLRIRPLGGGRGQGEQKCLMVPWSVMPHSQSLKEPFLGRWAVSTLKTY